MSKSDMWATPWSVGHSSTNPASKALLGTSHIPIQTILKYCPIIFFLHTKLFQTRFDPYGWQLNIKSIKKPPRLKLTIIQSGILYEHVGNIRPLLLTMDNLSGQLYTRNKSCR